MPVLILTESELRACVGFDAQCLRAIEDAFTWLSEGRVEMPPVMHIEVAEHHGDVDIKSACVRGLDSPRGESGLRDSSITPSSACRASGRWWWC